MVAAEIARRVVSGELAGLRLPSDSELARLCRCPITLMPAVLRRLADDGVIGYAPLGGRSRRPWLILRRYEKGAMVSRHRVVGFGGIADDLELRLLSGDLPGPILPTPDQLASEYSVSRAPIGEALRLLAAHGLVELRWLGASRPAWIVLGSPGSDELLTASDHAREGVRARVQAGEWEGVLPSSMALAAEYGAPVLPVQDTLRALAREGWVVLDWTRHPIRWVIPQEGVDYRPRRQQIAEVCGQRIRTGAWASGALVTMTEVAEEFATYPVTARKAFLLLEQEGLAVQNIPPGMGRNRTRWTVHHPDEATGGGSPLPVAGAVADDMARCMAAWPERELLPSRRLLERRYGAHAGIVQAALRMLESRGVIVAGAPSATGVVQWRRTGVPV